MREYTPIVVTVILALSFFFREKYLDKDMTPWFLSIFGIILVLIVGLLVKRLLR